MSTIEAADAQVERIAQAIYLIRGQRVMLDVDLAEVYGVQTKRLNEQARRNIARFPLDFMFQLTAQELANLKSHFATSSRGWGGRRKLPLAFTEHGAIMAASVLNTPQAVEMSVAVVRSFVRLRQIVQSHEDLWRKVLALEKKYDRQLGDVFGAIRALMEPPATSRRTIGFIAPSSGKKTRARRTSCASPCSMASRCPRVTRSSSPGATWPPGSRPRRAQVTASSPGTTLLVCGLCRRSGPRLSGRPATPWAGSAHRPRVLCMGSPHRRAFAVDRTGDSVHITTEILARGLVQGGALSKQRASWVHHATR